MISIAKVPLLSFSVHLDTTTFRQGDTILITINDYKPKYSYEFIFNDKKYVFTDADDKLQCYLGVPLDMNPRQYTLIVSRYSGGRVKEKRDIDIKIKKGNYPVEYVSFTPTKSKKITSPENKREINLIREAIKIKTYQKLWRDKFSVPVKGRISGVFGAERKRGKVILWTHKGIDIAVKRGTPVKSPAFGKVILIGEDFNLHGKTVIINHGIGVMTLYIHLDDIAVSPGEDIKRGEVIGYVGDTGLTTAPNLHWGIYVHSVPVNPLWWYDKN